MVTADTGRKAPETPFGVRLRAARKMAGLSMADLAAKLGGLVTKQAISKYEQGRMMPSPEVLERLISVLREATWGASPLRAKDALLAPELPWVEPGPWASGLGDSKSRRFRRQGLLKRQIKAKEKGPEETMSNAGGETSMSGSERKEVCFCVVDMNRPTDLLAERPDLSVGRISPPLADRRTRYLEAWRADPEVNHIRFRAGEKLSAKTEAALKHRIADHLQKYLEIESVLGESSAFENPLAEWH